jgi:hypothetical protein
MRLNVPLIIVTRGLDPRVHLVRKKMDCRVKPGNDTRISAHEERSNILNGGHHGRR